MPLAALGETRGVDLAPRDISLLERIAAHLGIAADLAHADLFILVPAGPEQVVVAAHAQPATAQTLYPRRRTGEVLALEPDSAPRRCLRRRRAALGLPGRLVRGIPLDQRAAPLRNAQRRLIAVLDMHKSAHYRRPPRRSSPLLATAAGVLARMLFADAVDQRTMLAILHSGDGIVVRDERGTIIFADARAQAIMRKVGVQGSLIGTRLDERTLPGAVVIKTQKLRTHTETEFEIGDSAIIKRSIPLVDAGRDRGRLSVICDVTELRVRQRQSQIKSAVVQEIHHRVKNNLQTIASLLRLQLRRADSDITRDALQESVGRILSIATVHDFLAREGTEAVDLKDLSGRILEAALGTNPRVAIRGQVAGPHILLPASQATPVAMAINELAANAAKHAFRGRERGEVQLTLAQQPGLIRIELADDGVGLPPGFSLERDANLGLQIVATLVSQDLGGKFSLETAGGTLARIELPAPAEEGNHG